jgi:hypothetical protein
MVFAVAVFKIGFAPKIVDRSDSQG